MESQKICGNIIGKILLFLFILLIVLVTINVIYQGVVLAIPQQTNQTDGLTNFTTFINNLPRHEINFAFFGSSHTMDAVNPTYIPNSYNFGEGGVNYVNAFHQLQWLKDNGLKINTIVFEIDMAIFSGIVGNEIILKTRNENLSKVLNKTYNQTIDLVKTNLKCNLGMIKSKNDLVEKINKCMPVIGHGRNFFLINQSKSGRQRALGWRNSSNNFANYTKEERLVMARNSRYFRDTNTKPQDDSWTYFLKSIDLAKNESKIVLIIYPVSKEYDMDLQLFNTSKKKYYNFLLPQIKAEGVNYILLDYYDIFFENPEYFDNPGHLNYKGAEVFSKILYQDLKIKSIWH